MTDTNPIQNQANKSTPIIWCLIAALFFGASTPAAKVLLKDVGPLSLAGLLYLGAAIAVVPFSFKGGSKELRRRPVNRRRILGTVFFGGIAGPVLLLLGLRMAPAASVSLWLNLEGLATALLGWLFFREHIGARIWLALAIMVAAGLLLSSPQGFELAPAAGLVLMACVCWGLDNNYTAILDGYTPAQITLAKGLAACAVNLALGRLVGEPRPAAGFIAWSLVIGALGYGVSVLLYVMGAQQLGATRSQLVFSTAPFIGVLIAWVGLGEPWQGVQVVAAALMVLGLACMISEHHSHPHQHQITPHTHLHRHDDGHHDHIHPDEAPGAQHTHVHQHRPLSHSHPHAPDLHHRHEHDH